MRVKAFNFGENPTLEQRFWQLAKTVYGQDKQWAPQSEEYYSDSIKAMQNRPGIHIRALIVSREVKVIARAVIIVMVESHQAWLGLFEALENESGAVQVLFEACEGELRQQGVSKYSAPRLDHQIIGLQTAGFDLPQSIMTPHNPAYYEQYFQENGFLVQTRSLSFIVRKEKLNLPELSLPWIKLRHFNLSKLTDEIEIFHGLQTAVFQGRKGYVARTLAQDEALIRSLLPLLDPELVIIAENKKGKALGILIALPDHYQSRKPLTRARILSIGTLRDYQAKGVGAMLVLRLAKTLLKKGYQSAEVSWVLKDNQPPQLLSRRFGAEPGREFCLYQKQLT